MGLYPYMVVYYHTSLYIVGSGTLYVQPAGVTRIAVVGSCSVEGVVAALVAILGVGLRSCDPHCCHLFDL